MHQHPWHAVDHGPKQPPEQGRNNTKVQPGYRKHMCGAGIREVESVSVVQKALVPRHQRERKTRVPFAQPGHQMLFEFDAVSLDGGDDGRAALQHHRFFICDCTARNTPIPLLLLIGVRRRKVVGDLRPYLSKHLDSLANNQRGWRDQDQSRRRRQTVDGFNVYDMPPRILRSVRSLANSANQKRIT